MIEVNYQRGTGGYSFSEAEIAILESLSDQIRDDFQSDQYQIGLGVPGYQAVYDMLTEWRWVPNLVTGVEEYRQVGKVGVDVGVLSGIDGARQVNANEGLFAGFIREYTVSQIEIRGIPSALTANQIANSASNQIAIRLLIDIIANKTLAGIEGIGAIDAGVAASEAFGYGDINDFAPWAGTLLFPVLGTSKFYEDLLLSDVRVSASLPNLEVPGTTSPSIIKYSSGTYDLLASLKASEIASVNASILNPTAAFKSLILGTGVPFPNQSALVAKTTAWFNSYCNLPADTLKVGQDVFLNPTYSLILDEYDYSVGSYGDDTLVAAGTILDPLDSPAVMNGGEGDDTITGSSRDDLLDGDIGDDHLFGRSGSGYLFGGTGNDNLNGQLGEDLLEGGAGDDTLNGGAEGDTLLGEDGLDIYSFSSGHGRDTILDSDGQGSIVINGATLTAGQRIAESDSVWWDSTKTYRIARVSDTQLLITPASGGDTILVKNCTMGLPAQIFGPGLRTPSSSPLVSVLERPLDLDRVLGTETVFLTNGGLGSIGVALHRGSDLLLVPQQAEQIAIARRLVTLRLGGLFWAEQRHSNKPRRRTCTLPVSNTEEIVLTNI